MLLPIFHNYFSVNHFHYKSKELAKDGGMSGSRRYCVKHHLLQALEERSRVAAVHLHVVEL